MLIVLGGLPGTGKTTIAKSLVATRAAAYVRVDEIEQAIKRHLGLEKEIGPAGYIVAHAIASSNLKLGNVVVADCVNPVTESRQGWRDVVRRINGARILEVEVVCSDEREHRRRVESRVSDVEDLVVPTWAAVVSWHYSRWQEPHLVIDTALQSPATAVRVIEEHMRRAEK